jgi:ABC-2 type transport system ATP-binding protein
MNTAISAKGLRKAYREKAVLDGVDLGIGEGEVFALLGPNGAGKPDTGLWLSWPSTSSVTAPEVALMTRSAAPEGGRGIAAPHPTAFMMGVVKKFGDDSGGTLGL